MGGHERWEALLVRRGPRSAKRTATGEGTTYVADRRRTSTPLRGPSDTAKPRRCPPARGRGSQPRDSPQDQQPPRLQDRTPLCSCCVAGCTQRSLRNLCILCVTWWPVCPGSVLHPAAAACPPVCRSPSTSGTPSWPSPCLGSCAPSGRVPCSLQPEPPGVQCELRLCRGAGPHRVPCGQEVLSRSACFHPSVCHCFTHSVFISVCTFLLRKISVRFRLALLCSPPGTVTSLCGRFPEEVLPCWSAKLRRWGRAVCACRKMPPTCPHSWQMLPGFCTPVPAWVCVAGEGFHGLDKLVQAAL